MFASVIFTTYNHPKWLEKTLNTKDVWFAPLEEIQAHVHAQRQSGAYTPRVEQLPYYTGPQR